MCSTRPARERESLSVKSHAVGLSRGGLAPRHAGTRGLAHWADRNTWDWPIRQTGTRGLAHWADRNTWTGPLGRPEHVDWPIGQTGTRGLAHWGRPEHVDWAHWADRNTWTGPLGRPGVTVTARPTPLTGSSSATPRLQRCPRSFLLRSPNQNPAPPRPGPGTGPSNSRGSGPARKRRRCCPTWRDGRGDHWTLKFGMTDTGLARPAYALDSCSWPYSQSCTNCTCTCTCTCACTLSDVFGCLLYDLDMHRFCTSLWLKASAK